MSFPHVRSTTQWRSAEREYIYRLSREGKITDEARRRIEREQEASIACKKEGGVEPPL
jgi:hypothetical protein